MLLQRGAEVQKRGDVLGIVVNGLAITGDGFGRLVLLFPRETQIVECIVLFWLQFDGFLIAGDGFVHMSLALLDDAQIVVGNGRFGPHGQGSTESAGLFGVVLTGMPKLEIKPEVPRVLDQRAADQASRVAPRRAEASPQGQQELRRLPAAIDLGCQSAKLFQVAPHLHLAEAVAPGVRVCSAGYVQQLSPKFGVVHAGRPEVQGSHQRQADRRLADAGGEGVGTVLPEVVTRVAKHPRQVRRDRHRSHLPTYQHGGLEPDSIQGKSQAPVPLIRF